MSLAALKSQLKADKKPDGKPLVHTRKNSKIFLPPEYRLDNAKWHMLIEQYNANIRVVLPAKMIEMYLSKEEPGEDITSLLSVSELQFVGGNYVTDLSFKNVKAGLRAMLLYESEHLRLIPILNEARTSIARLSLTYLPN